MRLSNFRFDCFHGLFLIASIVLCCSALSFWFDCNYLHKGICMYQWLLFEDVVLCRCWLYLLICIVVDHDVKIAAKQCFSCNTLCYLSTTSSYHKLHKYSAIGSRKCWSSLAITLAQNGMEWSGLLGGRNACGGKTATGVRLLQRCEWLQQPDHLRYITI